MHRGTLNQEKTAIPTGGSRVRGQEWTLSPTGNWNALKIDSNWSVTGLVKSVDSVPRVVERYVYDPYGRPPVLNGESAFDADGAVTDWSPDAGGVSDLNR